MTRAPDLLARDLVAAFLAAWALALGGCSGAGDPPPERVREPVSEPRLPESATAFAPAETRVHEGTRIHGQGLSNIDSCGRCHPDVLAQWSTSAHAWASFNNPVYRLSIEDFRALRGPRASQFCGGCHDIALLIDNAMTLADIVPEDSRAHVGVNCRVCHGVEETRYDGNGSFRLGKRPISVPTGNDSASVERHRQAASVRRLGSDLCITCHRSFLGKETGNDAHLNGQNDASDWQRSPYAGQGVARVDSGVPERDCVACHMPAEPASADERAATDGQVSSHRVLGGHTWLAAMRGDTALQARIAERLKGAVSIDIAAAVSRAPAGNAPVRTLPANGAPVYPGGELSVDVVLRNLLVGHRFPAGVKDAQDTWIEVTVRDAGERVIARSGHEHQHDPRDMEAHVLRSLVADQNGDVLFSREVGAFRAAIVDHTIAPRDAVVVRYTLDVPPESAGFSQPFSVTATLRHRTRNLILQERACASQETDLGRAFARVSRERRGEALDACRPQPVTDMAETRVWLGSGAGEREAGAARPAWQRLYEHGMAWTHAIQERLDEARPSLMAALDLVRADPAAGPREQAMVLAMLGRVSGLQGRTDEALEWLDQAEELAPGVPALASIRGAALAQVWRWQEAEEPLRRAAQAVPKNAGAWADLAIALGSLGKDREALEAARHGLVLEPRNTALLRVQALAIRALDGPKRELSLDAYDRFRPPDRALDIRFACAAKYPWCAREREPVHVHHLVPAEP